MIIKNLTALLMIGLLGACASTSLSKPPDLKPEVICSAYQIGTLKVRRVFLRPADRFTQGLVVFNNKLIESTGWRGKSRIYSYDLETGNSEVLYTLPNHYFGEAITFFENHFLQLTLEGRLLRYNDRLALIEDTPMQSSTNGAGWGLTVHNGVLHWTDGSSNLFKGHPRDYPKVGSVRVRDHLDRTFNANALASARGSIFANLKFHDVILKIHVDSGCITAMFDLRSIQSPEDYIMRKPNSMEFNGIAYDQKSDRFFITGKYFDKVWEVELN